MLLERRFHLYAIDRNARRIKPQLSYINYRQSPLESLTFRSKDAPALKPTGRYQENSEDGASVLAANQLNRQDDEQGMEEDEDMDKEYSENENDEEGQEEGEDGKELTPEEAETRTLN